MDQSNAGVRGCGCVAVAGFLLLLPAGSAQVERPAGVSVKPQFEVASVKLNKLANGETYTNFSLDSGNIYSTVDAGDSMTPTSGSFSARDVPLWRYIAFAYKLSGTQELALRFGFFAGLPSKAPAWVTGTFDSPADRFDIEARAEGNPTKDEMRLMLQSLLEDRFKLAVHHEVRQAPVFALEMVKPGVLGPHLQRHPGEDGCEATVGKDGLYHSAVGDLPVVCGLIAHVPAPVAGMLPYGGRNVPLSLLATSLPTMTGMGTISRPVVDQTGLSGLYDFTLGGWVSDANTQPDVSGPSFREALKEQLGLKLVPTTGDVDVLIVDHVERPTAN